MAFTNTTGSTQSDKRTFLQGLVIKGGDVEFTTSNPGFVVVEKIKPVDNFVTIFSGLSVTGALSGSFDQNILGTTHAGTDKSNKLATTQFVYDAIPHTGLYSTVLTYSAAWTTGAPFTSAENGTVVTKGNDSLGIGVTSAAATEKLTVAGNISARDIIYALDGNSNKWASAWSSLNTNSATWGLNELDISNVATNSADWVSTHTSRGEIALLSASWNTASTDSLKNNGVFTTVNDNSADWVSTYNTVSATSAKWAANESDLSVVALASGAWDSTKTSVGTYSGNWDNAWTKAQANESDITNVALNSGTWVNTYSHVLNVSSQWDSNLTSRSEIALVSANWNNAWTKSQSNETGLSDVATTSGSWDYVAGLSGDVGNISSIYSTVNNNSADWEGVWTTANSNSSDWEGVWSTVNTESSDWESNWSTVNANSATWGGGGDTKTTVADNSANWEAGYNDKINSASFNTSDGVLTLTQQDGGTVNVDLDGRYATDASGVNATSVYSTVNTNSAVWVSTALSRAEFSSVSANWTAGYDNKINSAAFATGTGVLTLNQQDGGTVTVDLDNRWPTGTGTQGYIPAWGASSYTLGETSIYFNSNRIGINTSSNLSIALTVSGAGTEEASISARDIVYAKENNSNQWSTAYTTVYTISSDWVSTHTTVYSTSARWESAWTSLNAQSADWESNWSTVNAQSGDWESNWSTTNTNSGDWEGVWSTVNTNSGTWNAGGGGGGDSHTTTTVNANSADWESAHTTVHQTSSVWTTTNSYSANWDSAYTKAIANEADLSVVALASGDWEGAWTTLNAQSADWESAWTVLNGESGDWESAWTVLNSESGDWESAWTSLNAESGDWESNWSTVNANSANWDSAITSRSEIAAVSSKWNGVWTTVNTDSADWNSTNTTVLTNSAKWSTAYTTVFNTSGQWSSAWTSLNAQSGDWESAWSSLNAQSADWESNWTTVNANSASWSSGSSTTTTVNANSATWSSPLSAKTLAFRVDESNSFSVGQVLNKGTAANGYNLASASVPASADTIGIVIEASASHFVYVHSGKAKIAGHGHAEGKTVFLSDSVAGGLTVTEPSVAGQVSKPVGVVIDSNNILIQPLRGIVIPGSSTPSTAAGWNDVGELVHTITDSDYVSIGTTVSGEKLTVAGNISAQGYVYAQDININGSLSVTGSASVTGHLKSDGIKYHGHITTIVPEFSATNLQDAVIDGAATINVTNNRSAGSSITLRISAYNTNCTLTWNNDWIFLGTKTTILPADKYGILSLQCFGSNESDVVASFALSN